MKSFKNLKPLALSVAMAGTMGTMVAPTAVQAAGWTGNLGGVSTYVYRGVYQSGAAGQAGVDYENDSGLYAGAWGSQVGTGNPDAPNGIETDFYAGWNGKVEGVNLGAGYTGYFYTNGFDNMYNELNLSAGINGITLAFNPGIYDGNNSKGDDTTFYYNINVSGNVGPFAAELGYNDWDDSYGRSSAFRDSDNNLIFSENTYLNLNYSRNITKNWDASIGYTASYYDDPEGDAHLQNYLILGVGTTFDL